MVRDRLMLAAAAFDGGLDPAAFHTAPSHEEALARIGRFVARTRA